VLDTGVDPGAAGMSRLIDVVDCTGAGDVNVGEEVEAELVAEEGEGEKKYWKVEGLSGRTIKLSAGLELRAFPGGKDGDEEEKKEESKDDESKKEGADADADNLSLSSSAAKRPVRLGLQLGYELFPRSLVRRIKAHRRRLFDAEQRRRAADVRTKLEGWRSSHPDASKATREDVRARDDLKALLDVLEPGGDSALESMGLDDPGPLFDCVVYYDGSDFRAVVVDAEECDGDATGVERGMTNFRKERRFGTFGTVDMLNYAVNFYEGGKVLSVVCDAGAHGSHVAGIAAGHRPAGSTPGEEGSGSSTSSKSSPAAPPAVPADGDGDAGGNESGASSHPDSDEDSAVAARNLALDAMSGVAPGADIVSLKIGDARLGSMETGSALVRALIYAIRHKIDVINLSYGEGAALPNSGRFAELADEMVRRYGVVFVSSAGNNGPAISTVGAPGGMIDACIGVAAYVSPDMMRAQYSSLGSSADGEEKDDAGALVGTTYTWSSVGPAPDGHNGVSVAAPGGAVTSVPTWTLRRNQLMNGTSMSSPHAAGCVALLLSACKAEGVPVSPARVRRALENTAQECEGLSALQQGHGMIRVDKAWEYLKDHRDDASEDVYFRVRIENRAGRPRGVYLRQPSETSSRQTFAVHVDPKFQTDDVLDAATQRSRVDFEMKFFLVSTAPDWVKCPGHLALMHGGKGFKIEVDPTSLPPGVHTARVHGYDSDRPGRGPLFEVPVTAVRTLEVRSAVDLGKLSFRPAEVKRFFLSVPPGATYMDVFVKDCRTAGEAPDASPRLVALHTVQLLPHAAYRDAECEKYLNLTPGQETVTSVAVTPGLTCEVTLARYWSTAGDTEVEADVKFRGVRPSPDGVALTSGVGAARVHLNSDVRDEVVSPSARLTKRRTPLRPKADMTSVSPLSADERDTWPSDGGKLIHQLVLTYKFEQEEAGTFVPRFPALQGYLYESAYESQLALIFDGEKRYLGCADSWPDGVKAPKGDVVVRLQVRYDNPEMLEKLRDLPLWIERKLGKDVSLSVYPSHEAAVSGKESFRKRHVRRGACSSVFVAEPSASDLPKGCKCGDVLMGTVTYEAGDDSLPGAGKKPGGFPLTYVVGPDVESKKDGEAGKTPDPPDERSVMEKLEEAVRGTKVKELEKLAGDEKEAPKFEELYAELRKDYATHLPLLMAGLRFFDRKDKRAERLDTITDAADEVVKLVPETELAVHFGIDYDKEDPVACKKRKDMEEKKTFLVEALARKARAISSMDEEPSGSFDATLKDLQKWADIASEKKFAVLALEKEKRAKRMGSVLKSLNDLLKNKGEDTKGGICPLTKSDILQRRAEVFEQLGLSHLATIDQKWRSISAPKEYALF